MHPRYYLLFLSLFLAAGLRAQFGVAAYYNMNTIQEPGPLQGELADILDDGPEIALNYWFRLPKQRVEFLPTVFYNRANTADDVATNRQIGVQWKTNIYPFDFLGDCDCPTFGKQGPQLQKGFFVQLAPGYTFNKYKINGEVAGQLDPTFDNSFFTLAGAIGLDVGLSNFLTLTPNIGYRRDFGGLLKFETTDINGVPTGTTEQFTKSSFQFGLHLGFRLDADKY